MDHFGRTQRNLFLSDITCLFLGKPYIPRGISSYFHMISVRTHPQRPRDRRPCRDAWGPRQNETSGCGNRLGKRSCAFDQVRHCFFRSLD